MEHPAIGGEHVKIWQVPKATGGLACRLRVSDHARHSDEITVIVVSGPVTVATR